MRQAGRDVHMRFVVSNDQVYRGYQGMLTTGIWGQLGLGFLSRWPENHLEPQSMSWCQSLWGSEWLSLPSHVCFWTHVVMVSLANIEASWKWQRLKWDKLKQKSSVLILQRKSRHWDTEVRWFSLLCTTAPSCLPGDDSERTQVNIFLMISFYWAWSPPQSSFWSLMSCLQDSVERCVW